MRNSMFNTVSVYQGKVSSASAVPRAPPATASSSSNSNGLPKLPSEGSAQPLSPASITDTSASLASSSPSNTSSMPTLAGSGSGDRAVGGSLGLLRARDTGNSPSRTRLSTPLSNSYREISFNPPQYAQPQFSATNPFSNALSLPKSAGAPKRTPDTTSVTSSLDTALRNMTTGVSSSGIAHGIFHKDSLLPPLYVPPIDFLQVSTPVPVGSTDQAIATNAFQATPTSSATIFPQTQQGDNNLKPQPLQHRGSVTIAFDLDETLCNNRRPGKALLRPHALELLHHLNALRNDPSVNCYVELVLWTASMECVARPVVERLDPTGTLFQHLIYRDRRWYKETGYTKDLKRLGREMHHTVIIENSPASVHLNRKHSILVRDFVSGQDHELMMVKEILDGWIRQVGQCAMTLNAPPPNEANSPSSIVKYLSEHPHINSGNEVINTRPTTMFEKPTTSNSLRSSSLGLSVSRFALNRPSLYPGRR